MDIGLHLFDLARFLMGDVATVACLTQRLNPRVRGEDAFTALLGHGDGGVTSVECSFYARTTPDPFPETFARIEGPGGHHRARPRLPHPRPHRRRRARDRRRPAGARPGARGPGTSSRTRSPPSRPTSSTSSTAAPSRSPPGAHNLATLADHARLHPLRPARARPSTSPPSSPEAAA